MRYSLLIVDDTPEFADVARAHLEPQGVDILGVATASAEALAQTRRLRPDVVLVDVNLGSESGFDLVRQMSVDPGCRASLILMSTYAEADLARLIADSPASGFLSKHELSADAIDWIHARARRRSSTP